MSGSNAATSLRLERLIPVSPETLFALWIEPAQLVKWWAPDGYVAVVDKLESLPGGRWRVVVHRADGGTVATSGVYTRIEPPYRLAFTWAWETEGGKRGHETEVEVIFEPAPGGCRLVLSHSRFENAQVRDNHERGWAGCLDRIAQLANSRTEL